MPKVIARMPFIVRTLWFFPAFAVWLVGFLLTRPFLWCVSVVIFIILRAVRMLRALPLIGAVVAVILIAFFDQEMLGYFTSAVSVLGVFVVGTMFQRGDPNQKFSEEQMRIVTLVKALFKEIFIQELGAFTHHLPVDLHRSGVVFVFICSKAKYWRFIDAANLAGIWFTGYDWYTINDKTDTHEYTVTARAATAAEMERSRRRIENHKNRNQ